MGLRCQQRMVLFGDSEQYSVTTEMSLHLRQLASPRFLTIHLILSLILSI